MAIINFRNSGLEDFFYEGNLSGIDPNHEDNLGTILDRLDAAQSLRDMNIPKFKLHKLKGKLKDFFAVDVNKNWRVIFRFENGKVYDVDYVDYH